MTSQNLGESFRGLYEDTILIPAVDLQNNKNPSQESNLESPEHKDVD
jgi:hypothetical protein